MTAPTEGYDATEVTYSVSVAIDSISTIGFYSFTARLNSTQFDVISFFDGVALQVKDNLLAASPNAVIWRVDRTFNGSAVSGDGWQPVTPETPEV
jgi:hypothetical protein